MRISTLIMSPLLLTACIGDPIPDCENSTLTMDYADGTPEWELDLRCETGKELRQDLEVTRIDSGVATCEWSSGFTLWEVAGHLDTVVYGEVPDDAVALWDANEEPDAGFTKELIEGTAYSAQGWLLDHLDNIATACASWEFVWIQGEPDSVVQCEPHE